MKHPNATVAFQKALAVWERTRDAAKKKARKFTDLKPKCAVQPVAPVRPKLKDFLEGASGLGAAGGDEEAGTSDSDADDDEEVNQHQQILEIMVDTVDAVDVIATHRHFIDFKYV